MSTKLEFRIRNFDDIWWQDQDLHFIDEQNTEHVLTSAYLAGRKVEFEGNAINIKGDVTINPAQLTYEAYEYESKPVKTEINITRLERMSNELRKLADSDWVDDSRDKLRQAAAEIELLNEQVAQLKKDLDEALVALRKIYEYRSDKPDWNMVMAIAGDVVEPMLVSI